MYFGSVLYWQRWLTGCYISWRVPTPNVFWQCTLLATLAYRVLHFLTFSYTQCTLAVYFTGNVGLQGVTFPDVFLQPMYFGSVFYRCRQTFRKSRLQNVTCPNIFLLRIRYCGSVPGGMPKNFVSNCMLMFLFFVRSIIHFYFSSLYWVTDPFNRFIIIIIVVVVVVVVGSTAAAVVALFTDLLIAYFVWLI